jgi:predicted transcriptional regulator
MGNRDIDEDKRATLRRFATIGAASPLAALGGGKLKSRADTTDKEGAQSRKGEHEQTEKRSEVREAIVGYVGSAPGVHFSKLRDELQLGTGETQYHLRRLVDGEKLTVHRDGDYKRFFLNGQFSTFEQVALGFLRRATPRGILIELLKDPTATGADLAAVLDVSQATISTYSSKLVDAGLISRSDGDTVRQPEIILRLILRYADSLGADAVTLADEADELIQYSP